MSPSNPSSYPTLTSNWTPASSCAASTAFWYVVYAPHVVFSNMFGMPSVTNIGQKATPTGGCVPPSYTLSTPYLTDGGCPSSYFRACSTGTYYGGQEADYIWCCPSVEGWNFNCAPATDTGAAPYGCIATFRSGDIVTGSRTDLLSRTGQAETHTIGGDHGVNAWGIALLSTSAQSTTTVATMTTHVATASPTNSTISMIPNLDSSPDSSPQGLSTGAAAGIGVGVGITALVIGGILVFWFLRRKYKSKQQQQQHQQQQQQQQKQQQPLNQTYQAGYQASYHAASELGQYSANFDGTTAAERMSTPSNTEMTRPDLLFELSDNNPHVIRQGMDKTYEK